MEVTKMTDYEKINLSKDVVKTLESLTNDSQKTIDDVVKNIISENEKLKKINYLTTTKVSKNKSTYSTVIPAPIKNKFEIEKGQVLYWDIDKNKIIITPDVLGTATEKESTKKD